MLVQKVPNSHDPFQVSGIRVNNQKNIFFITQPSGSLAEWLVHWTRKLATLVHSQVAAGLSTDYSVLGGNLTGYCYQQYWPRLG